MGLGELSDGQLRRNAPASAPRWLLASHGCCMHGLHGWCMIGAGAAWGAWLHGLHGWCMIGAGAAWAAWAASHGCCMGTHHACQRHGLNHDMSPCVYVLPFQALLHWLIKDG